eukprot:871812_1
MPVLNNVGHKSMSHSASTSKIATPRKTLSNMNHNNNNRRLKRHSSTHSLLNSPTSKSLHNNPVFEILTKDERFAAEVSKEEMFFESLVSRQKTDMEKMIAYEIKMM